ncbi:MAG: hypothetical protein HY060_19745 [Proteobacteria bacterium]|nr:hypothetical protein [Pseudomonadota bacterium]
MINLTARRPRVGWTLSRRIQIFLERKLLDLSLDEARDLHGALGRAIDQAGALPETRRINPTPARRRGI